MIVLFDKTMRCLRPLTSITREHFWSAMGVVASTAVTAFLVFLLAPAITVIARMIVDAMFEGRFA